MFLNWHSLFFSVRRSISNELLVIDYDLILFVQCVLYVFAEFEAKAGDKQLYPVAGPGVAGGGYDPPSPRLSTHAGSS